MKKSRWVASVLALVLILCAVPAWRVGAKDLEKCYHCDNTGKFHCPYCNNTGEAVCDGCGGAGRSPCQGEPGKGCNNGYYTCPSCSGDGLSRPIPADGNAGPCGNCGGSGKLRCIVCHTVPGWNICNRCDGKGKMECQGSNCKAAKAVGWKCPYCNGAGYLLVGFPMPPSWKNDGVQNVPQKGDYIVTDNKTWQGYTYGGGASAAAPATTTAPAPAASAAPAAPAAEPVPATEPDQSFALPQNRNEDYDIPAPAGAAEQPRSFARIEIGAMTDEQQRQYAALEEEDLKQILQSVQAIVSTAQPGKADAKTEELLQALVSRNGFSSLEEASLLPIEFDGHADLGFPVLVTVRLEEGVLAGGHDLFVYHLTGDGTIELLEKADYTTYEDGSVETLSFHTTGFSSFFTAEAKLDLTATVEPSDETVTTGAVPGKESDASSLPFLIGGAVGVCVVTAGIIVYAKTKKKSKPNE